MNDWGRVCVDMQSLKEDGRFSAGMSVRMKYEKNNFFAKKRQFCVDKECV